MRAVITDLDRTLLRTDKSISEYTLSVLEECRRRGILIMAESARPFRSIQKYHELIKFDALTTMNGAVVFLPHEILQFGISRESGEKILSELIKFNDISLSIETDRGLYSNRDIPEWKPIVYDGFPALPENTVLYKILASGNESRLYKNISDILTDDVYSTVAVEELVQIMSSEATKWNGIKKMLSHFGASPDDAVYFGDDNDDIEPIASCATGVAVANAIPAVLEIADSVTSSNDSDGVARFIEENIL